MAPRFYDCKQGTPEWFECRLGIPTASNFAAILAKGEGKTRRSYLHRLAAEILTGEPAETFQSAAMERGKQMEDEARNYYAFIKGSSLQRIGFVRNGICGASPDSLIGADGGLEIKTQRADLLVETILADRLPPEHKAQVQGNMLVTERAWWDLSVYWPKMPPFIIRVERDEPYIDNLRGEIAQFNDDLQTLVAQLRRYGRMEKAA